MKYNDLKIKIFADGADLNGMLDAYNKGIVKGFTTNPSLMKKQELLITRNLQRKYWQK